MSAGNGNAVVSSIHDGHGIESDATHHKRPPLISRQRIIERQHGIPANGSAITSGQLKTAIGITSNLSTSP